ncbi:MAG: sensor histidine kinase, partial [Chloroflexia bacterium]
HLTPEEQDYLERIERNSSWIVGLVQDMLFLSRIDAVPEEREPIALTTLVQGVSTHLQLERLGVLLSVQEGMPVVQADPVLFWHLFRNLLRNACRLLPPGDAGRIDVRCEPLPGAYRVVLEIVGASLSAEEQKHLFDLFPPEGKGQADIPDLGLGIARRIVQRYGGQIWIEGVQGRSIRFCLLLPEECAHGEGKE